MIDVYAKTVYFESVADKTATCCHEQKEEAFGADIDKCRIKPTQVKESWLAFSEHEALGNISVH